VEKKPKQAAMLLMKFAKEILANSGGKPNGIPG
jgi:hypothetical protein